jgi:hypothetical protein
MSFTSRPEFLSFEFDEKVLEKIVASKFLSIEFDAVLIDLTMKLTQLRTIIYSINWVDGASDSAVWSENRIQCMMILFLNYTFKACNVLIVATAANTDAIELKVTNQDNVEVEWNGYADLKCSSPELSLDVFEAVATLEMKVPFNPSDPRLYHSKALQPKQQLLGQAMGLLQSSGRPYVISYLTDIVALSVMHHVKGKAYLSKRVTDAKAFCLRLLLMCCGLGTDEWADLLGQVDTTAVEIDDEDDPIPSASSGSSVSNPLANRRTEIADIHTRSQNKSGGNNHKKHNVCDTFGYEEEEVHQRRLADITNGRRWEAKCSGFKYLGVDEMKWHDSNML